jgi:MFS family permease
MADVAGRRTTMGLLVAATVIVAADKSVFAFAGVRIMDDLHLTPAAFGLLGSAFFLLYSASGVAFGFLANRWPARWLLLSLALIWAGCQAGVASSSSLAVLAVLRVLLGVGAGPSTALVQHACFKWYAPRERVLPAASMNIGLMVGILLSAGLLPWLIAHHGWRLAYLVLAGLSLAWAVAWVAFGREGRGVVADDATDEATSAAGPARYRDVLLDRSFVATTALSFAGYLISGLGFSWNPVWMQKGLGFTAQQVGPLVMAIMLGVILALLGVSALSQRWLRRGASTRNALVRLPVGCCLLGGVALLAIALPGLAPGVRLALAGLAMVLTNIQQSFGVTVCGDLCRPAQRGAVLAIHLAFSTSAGIVAPLLAGTLVTAAGGDIAVGFERTLVLIGALTVLLCVACLAWVDPAATRARRAAAEAALAAA